MERERIRRAATWTLGGLFGLGLAFLTAGPAEAVTRTVPTSPGCDTIQNCVDSSAPGDTVRILPKTGAGKPNDAYYENVVVDVPDLTITGTDCKRPTRVTVDGAPNGDPGDIVFGVSAEDVTIKCLRTRHGTIGIGVEADGFHADRVVATSHSLIGIGIDGDDFVVERSTIIGVGDPDSDLIAGDGILTDGDNGRVSRNTVRNARVDCFDLGGADLLIERNNARECGGEVEGEGFNTSGDGFEINGTNMRLFRNTAHGAIDDGFDIFCDGSCTDAVLDGNTAEDNGDDGFSVVGDPEDNLEGFLITNNTARRNKDDGIDVIGNGTEIRGNRAERNGTSESFSTAGIDVEGNGNLLVQNVAQRNQRDGFNVFGDDNTLRQNRANENRKDGFDLEDGSDNTLDRNQATKNQAEGIENNATATDITNNVSRGNRIDCAADVPPATNTGNTCADGSNFAVSPEIESEREKPAAKER